VTTYHFHSVGWQVIEDRIRPAGDTAAIADLPVAAQYVWSPHYVDELILIDRDLNADGDLSDAGERLYVQQDANYNVTSVVSDTLTSGEGSEGFQPGVVERYQYDPYGRREVLNADWSLDTLLGADGTTGDDSVSAGNTSDVGMLHGHQGGQHDVESHLVHFRNRDLNGVLGRWTRQDPLGYVDGGNLYEYMMSGPTRWVDPWGLEGSTPRAGDRSNFAKNDAAQKEAYDEELADINEVTTPSEVYLTFKASACLG
jgi:RHS repeat-associated protein